MLKRRPTPTLLLITFVVAVGAFAGLPTLAQAGQWGEVSCMNPNGTSAPAQGWTATGSPLLSPPASASASCNASSAMYAILPTSAAGTANSSEVLSYSPPTGSTLAGGQMTVGLTAEGHGQNAQPNDSSGAAIVMSPVSSTNDEVETCAYWSDGCWAGESVGSNGVDDFSGTISLPQNAGGTVTVFAGCLAEGSATNCDEGGANGYWASASVSQADLLLTSNETPSASSFGGSALSKSVSGVADLTFDASESVGPGIYNVTVAIDGNVIYDATPDANGGECVSEGAYPGTSALLFDYSQPCPSQENVDVPIDTTATNNGTHMLTVTITDAAGNTATVYDGRMTIDNPLTTPLPAATKGVSKVRVRFSASTRYSGAYTRLVKITHTALPRGARVTVAVSGPRHPKLRLSSASGAKTTTLLDDLTRLTFRSGDKLTITVSAPRKQAERLELTFRNARLPTAKLL